MNKWMHIYVPKYVLHVMMKWNVFRFIRLIRYIMLWDFSFSLCIWKPYYKYYKSITWGCVFFWLPAVPASSCRGPSAPHVSTAQWYGPVLLLLCTVPYGGQRRGCGRSSAFTLPLYTSLPPITPTTAYTTSNKRNISGRLGVSEQK